LKVRLREILKNLYFNTVKIFWRESERHHKDPLVSNVNFYNYGGFYLSHKAPKMEIKFKKSNHNLRMMWRKLSEDWKKERFVWNLHKLFFKIHLKVYN